MKKELRVLLVEDIALDAEIIDHELRKGSLPFRFKRVETEHQFLHELEHHRPDVILSDHGIPAFDGFTALARARERCPEVPFIFVTGAHGDEVAVETLRRGADDYVLKSRLHHLVPAIQRALRHAEARAQHRHTETALRETQEQLHLFAEEAKDYALLRLDLEGRVAGWNAGAQEMTGHSAAEVQGRDFAGFFPDDEQDRARRALTRVLREGRREETGWRLLRKDGTEFPAAATLAVTHDPSRKPRAILCVLHDLTRQKQLAEEAQARLARTVRQRTAQIAADHRELQEFTYTLALDLRTPLRHLDSFVELLQKTAGDKLDPKSRGCLQTIAEAGRQIGRLSDELLTFTRIGQTEMYHLQFSLTEVVKEILQELRCETEGRHIEWVIGKLPEVSGDPTLLGLALTNLISNALKFTRPRKQARIEVGSHTTDREVIVFVADNGVGFDPRYMDKLFGAFQRLHSDKRFEGMGIGLANVRRIVQRHGGRTWAEGAIDRGATFYFSLPRPQAPELPAEEASDN
jgi:PAS domain S-box-containing protein